MIHWISTILFAFLFVGNNIKFAQQNKTTSYNSKENSEINILLEGRVKSLVQYSYLTNTNFRDTISYIFDSKGFPEIIVTTNRTILNIGAGKTVYNFESGKLRSKKYYENNNLLTETVLKYDTLNRLTESRDYSTQNTSSYKYKKSSFIEIYQYNSIGQQTAYTMNNISNKIYHKWVYIYDINGNKIEEGTCENYKGIKDHSNCKYKPLHGYKYNYKNQLVKKFDCGKWSPNNTEIYYQYDEHGNVIDVKGLYITSDKVLGYHYVYQYDESGNKIKEEELTGNYLSIDFDKYKYLIMRYDVYQNIIQQEYYTSDNKQVRVNRYLYLYDSFGNWIKREKYVGKTQNDLSIISVDERTIEYYQ